MADRTLTLLEGLVNRLDAQVTDLNGKFYLQPPQEPVYPYAKISSQVEPWNNFTQSNQQHTVRVQIFSNQQKAAAECTTLRAAVYDALNRQESNVTLSSGNVVLLEQTGFADAFVEADGKTWQAVIEFNVLTQ